MTTEKNRALDQAKAQLESITEMVAALKEAESSDHIDAETMREQAMTTIQEDALSVAVRSEWHAPGDANGVEDAEYKILLCTGGPACQIIGELYNGQPETARIEYQDWGTPWTEYRLTADEEKTVLIYASQFYYGE